MKEEWTMGDSLRGKIALVTGGSRGIGRAIALQLAASGANVVIGYLKNEAKADEVVATITAAGGKAKSVRADLSRPDDVAALFNEAERTFGRLDIVVANAADILVKPLVDCSEEDYDRIFNANTKSVFLPSKRPRGASETEGVSWFRRRAERGCSSPISRSISAARAPSSNSSGRFRGSWVVAASR